MNLINSPKTIQYNNIVKKLLVYSAKKLVIRFTLQKCSVSRTILRGKEQSTDGDENRFLILNIWSRLS
jgi:hypothetical protein